MTEQPNDAAFWLGPDGLTRNGRPLDGNAAAPRFPDPPGSYQFASAQGERCLVPSAASDTSGSASDADDPLVDGEEEPGPEVIVLRERVAELERALRFSQAGHAEAAAKARVLETENLGLTARLNTQRGLTNHFRKLATVNSALTAADAAALWPSPPPSPDDAALRRAVGRGNAMGVRTP